MWMSRTIRPWLFGATLVLPLAWSGYSGQRSHGQQPAADPVEELRQALKIPVRDPMKNPGELEFRRRNIEERIKALRTVGDLRRALQLQAAWRADDEGDPDIRKIDLPLRVQVAERFRESLRAAMKSPDASAQLAAADLLEDIGSTLQDSGDNHGGVARPLTKDLVALLKAPNARVRASAAHALGRINAEPALAAPALGQMLQTEKDPELRRAAATGLAGLVNTVLQLRKSTSTGASANLLTATPEEVTAVCLADLPQVGPAVADPDVQVRRLAIDAIQLCAAALADLVPVGDTTTGTTEPLPPVDRPWTKEEQTQVDNYRKKIAADRAELMPLANALQSQGRAIARALTDPDPAVRLTACRALDEVAHTHDKLQVRDATIPVQDGARPKTDGPLAKLVLANLPAIDDLMRDPDPRVRLTLLDALFMLGAEAKPAVPTLVRALADPSLFVRWSAVRVLGKTGPVNADESVPAIAALLRDPDLNVRVAAAGTLERYGTEARAAIPQLIRAVASGDAEMRLSAIQTLAAMGSVARPAIPALIGALTYDDDRVQKAAAEALGRGRFGAAARSAEGPLRQAMNDDDPEVRKAASEALLNILQAK